MHRKRADREKELDREVRDHLELDAESRTHPGLNSGDASYAARRDFGNVTLVKEVTREMWAWNSLDRFLHNVRYALRTLRRNPGFAAVAIFTLALGVGANAAMFSITNAVLLRPLAYPDSDRIISITMEDASRGITAINLSFTRLTLLQEQSRTMETVGAYLPLSLESRHQWRSGASYIRESHCKLFRRPKSRSHHRPRIFTRGRSTGRSKRRRPHRCLLAQPLRWSARRDRAIHFHRWPQRRNHRSPARHIPVSVPSCLSRKFGFPARLKIP